jgi:hypothetical protein
MIQNDTFRWGVNSHAEDLHLEDDGSAILHFAAEQPGGVADRNWIETNPEESYFVWFRTYGPTNSWYDGTWVLPNIQNESEAK